MELFLPVSLHHSWSTKKHCLVLLKLLHAKKIPWKNNFKQRNWYGPLNIFTSVPSNTTAKWKYGQRTISKSHSSFSKLIKCVHWPERWARKEWEAISRCRRDFIISMSSTPKARTTYHWE